jgi:hypothetical protein
VSISTSCSGSDSPAWGLIESRGIERTTNAQLGKPPGGKPNTRRLDFPPTEEPPWRLRLLTVGAVTIDHRWRTAGVFSSFWRLYAVGRAGSEVRWNGGRHPVDPHRVHLIPAWFGFDCYNDRPVPHLFVHFDVTGPAAVVLSESLIKPLALPREGGPGRGGPAVEAAD